MNLAIIPASGGSKRISCKNIKPFCGKPMIAWSIEAAQASGRFDRLTVSTDDEEVAATARKWVAQKIGFMCNFLWPRPRNCAPVRWTYSERLAI